jgi:hypothetical protein
VPSATDPPASGDAPKEPDPATFLQVCRTLAGTESRPPVPCEDAVVAALAVLARTTPTRVEVAACGALMSCPKPDADRVFVDVLARGTTTEVELVRGTDGGLAVHGTGPGAIPVPPPYTAPPTGRAALPGAPASLASRPAYPLCGTEDTPMGGPYDERARTCFLDGVLAGSPVEFASVGRGTEGGQYVRLYRYDGSGGLEVVTGEDGAWQRAFTGIAEAGGGLVFDIGGMSTEREPVP